MNIRICLTIATAILFLAASSPTNAMMKEGCASGECTDCHSLTREEAENLLAGTVDNVLSVKPSAVGGLWAVDVVKEGRKWPVYIDFSKNYLISGQVIRMSSKENVTESRSMRLNALDVSSIPIDDAIVIGNPEAKRRIIEFSDPDCGFCAKPHSEARKIVAKNPDVAFFVKLYSRRNNPTTIQKILSIVCGKQDAPKLLDDAFAGKPLPQPGPTCDFAAVQETAKLAGKLGIRGTPVMILPDGRVVNGYRDAETILKLLEETPPSAQAK
ncbi:MAG: DsbC family protein [Deltaproteobacteria bacterium]|nr:MAG: DsbC family protein [Deltaproteobacteria bacterium]